MTSDMCYVGSEDDHDAWVAKLIADREIRRSSREIDYAVPSDSPTGEAAQASPPDGGDVR